MRTPSRLSVWLEPSAADELLLGSLINACTRVAEGTDFPAHVTVASAERECGAHEFDFRALTRQLRREPLELCLSKLAFGRDYHRCAFLDVPLTPQLSELTARGRRWLGAPRALHPPHLSLCYGWLTVEARSAIETLTRRAPQRSLFDRLSLWDTSGEVASWSRLAESGLS